MWRSQHGDFSQEILENAQRGLLNKRFFKGTSGLGKCCKDRANGDFNYELLCLHHMLTFEGFLGMVEDPKNIEDDNGNDEGLEDRHRNQSTSIISNLRKSPSCPDKHWSPVTTWRMEQKFYPKLNFIGHLETAQWDIKRLLDILHPEAWDNHGASGWGKYRNESMFESSTTVNHAKKSENYLFEHYTSEKIERRVEKIYEDDYDSSFLDLERVPIGHAQSFYRNRFLHQFGADV